MNVLGFPPNSQMYMIYFIKKRNTFLKNDRKGGTSFPSYTGIKRQVKKEGQILVKTSDISTRDFGHFYEGILYEQGGFS